MQETMSPEVINSVAPLILIVIILVVGLLALALNILYVVAFCKIFSKAGYHWAMGLLMLVPIANFVMPLVLAFGQWPVFADKQNK